MNSRLGLWGPVVAYMAIIFTLSGMSSPPMPEGASDTSWHAIGYFGLGVVVTRAVARGLPARITLRIALLALALAVGYGATDEFHQRFVPGRTPALDDLLADATGSALAICACWAWGIISPLYASRREMRPGRRNDAF